MIQNRDIVTVLYVNRMSHVILFIGDIIDDLEWPLLKCPGLVSWKYSISHTYTKLITMIERQMCWQLILLLCWVGRTVQRHFWSHRPYFLNKWQYLRNSTSERDIVTIENWYSILKAISAVWNLVKSCTLLCRIYRILTVLARLLLPMSKKCTWPMCPIIWQNFGRQW